MTPEPTRERWQPLRAGVVDLFYYDVEEFHFHGGSLLLRGNNGTGKSKVLALTLPFLLDGELSPHRVEPDGDRNKRMEWNLLLGGKYPHPERLGYTWLEFGRRDLDGTARFVTIGCGLKAVAGKGIAKHWFFVTDQRIGPELSLLNPTRTALTRERLKEAIGERGLVYDRAGDYRRAVDEALFGLGSRYDALVSLLIQLRQPQLSKRPDERLLSNALTEALPPLDENLITQVAEAFRSLDDERDALRGLRETKKAADEFLTGYHRYARIATRRRAAGTRETQSRYEKLGRDLGDTQRAYEEAQAALEAAEDHLKALDGERARLGAHDEALRASPEMRDASSLELAAQRARELAGLADQQRGLYEAAGAAVTKHTDKLGRATSSLNAAEHALAGASSGAADSAATARIGTEHADRVAARLDTDEPPYTGTRRAAETVVAWRAQSLRTLGGLLTATDKATDALRIARGQLDTSTTQLAAADGRIAAAEHQITTRGAELVAGIREHLAAGTELRVPDAEQVVAALELWVETLDGDNPATTAVTSAFRDATEKLTWARTVLESGRQAAEDRRGEIVAEISRLEEGGHQAPPAPHTRGTRGDRPGAPLWRVVDFAPQVPENDRSGLEAALEASGILDAWVSPDATLAFPDADDVLLRAATPVAENLTRVLRPAIDPADAHASALTDDVVRRILATIGLGPASAAGTWMGTDGRFAIGVLAGRWRKDGAEHIGESARAQARRARIGELRAEHGQIETRLAAIGEELEGLRARQDRLTTEHRDVPQDAELRDAHTMVRTAHETRRQLAELHQGLEDQVFEAAEQVELANRQATEFAEDVDLPVDRTALEAVNEALGGYRVALAGLWPAAATLAAARLSTTEARAELGEADLRLTGATAEHADAARAAMTAREHHEVLAATVGTAVAELQRRLAEIASEVRRCERDERQARAAEREALDARGKALGRQETLTEELTSATRDRDAAVDSLRHFAATGLMRLACPDLEAPDPAVAWAATPAVYLARSIDRELADVDDGDRRWELAQQQVNAGFKLLADGLSRHGHTAALSVREETMLVDTTFQGRTQPVTELATALEVEVEERQRVLSAHEREVLETHLVNEVAGTLQELISTAEQQVSDMNRELEERPTSTGMRLRLLWRTAKDAPTGLSELRERLLRQSSDVWNDADRRRVGTFLQEQISAERLRDDAGTWQEQLTRALDYRSWHEFAIQRHQDGQWRSAAGPASGGERVLAASVPLFAAASSYYGSAGNPHAPRLIALDEAFAGVDDDSRAKCLGLLAKFDLDVVMTSEREWGCYPEVPGLAIAQLARHEGIDAVLVTPWQWDGRERRQVPRPTPHIPAQPRPTGDGQDGLFDDRH